MRLGRTAVKSVARGRSPRAAILGTAQYTAPGYCLGEAGSTRSDLCAGCDEAPASLSSGGAAGCVDEPRSTQRAAARDHRSSELPGFFVQSTACLLLIIGAGVGMAMRFGGN
jgi:hypothetical protein